MRQLLFILLMFLTSHLHAADYYWVGGGGNWSDLNHWHLGSTAGPTPSIVPSSGDNVFFTSGSGFGTTVATRTVTLNANGFCNNMTWESGVPNNPIFTTANATFTVEVWGNMSLSPTTTYTCIFEFKGATPATITSNGTVLGAFGITIDKPASSLTVADSLIVPSTPNVPTSYVTLTSGTLDISGKKLRHLRFVSNNTNVRTLEMTNADVTFPYYYDCRGANKTINAAGSTLNALGYLLVDGGTYPRVFNNATDNANFFINNTTFGALTFINTSATSQAQVDAGNTIDSLIFMGQGRFCCNNTISYLRFDKLGTFISGNNNVRHVECHGGLNIGNAVNTVDTLLLASNYTTNFKGTFNINKYLYVNGAPCEAFTEITGDSVNGTINFDTGAVASLSNVYLTGVKATGPITPIAVNGIDGEGNTGFVITPPGTIAGTTLYWVGGAGDWNDRNHWSTTSGGAGLACVPFINDDVIFDGNSGLSTTGTVTTSSASFCKNMTWSNVGNITFNESSTSAFRMYGSLVMDSTVTMNAILEFHGSDSTTAITTNGSMLGTLQFLIRKTGNGKVTLMDNWTNTAGSIFHTSGGVIMAQRTVSISYYWSSSSQARSLDITNATINVASRWDYSGSNRTMVAAGSHITCPNIFVSNAPAMYYPWVDLGYTGAGSAFAISSTQFGQLTFTATGGTVNASIDGSNTIRRLEFKGRGVITAGGNTIDTLILADSRNYFFGGTNTITKYLQAQSTPCAGLSEIKGYPLGTIGTLTFTSGAVANMSNIYMQNMTATGPVTPIAFNGADAGGNTGWTITSTAGAPRYWIGGSGDWNDNTHWSATSGGAGGACIPTVFDDVYFDANSGFTAASKTVTINNGNAYCRNVNWTGAANSPIWSKSASWNLEAWGDSVVVIAAATFNVSPLTVKGPSTTYLQGSAPLGNFDITIDKPGGGLALLNNYSNTGTDFALLNGAFNASGKTLNVNVISNNDLANASNMDISNANITTIGWRYSNTATNHTLNAANSTINTTTFVTTGLTYNKVNVSGTAGTHAQLAGATVDSLIFTNPSTASLVGINGANNNLNYVEYKGSGNVYSTGNTINTLVFFPGKIYTFTAGTTTNITNLWFASGTPCNLTEIVSSSTTANATINKIGGAPEFDYVRVRRITAAGSIPFVAFNHTIDQGNNTNWNIAPYNGVAPIYGLGPDTALLASAFPYVLHTDGFFGNPSSQYLWNTGSTADSLVVTDTGIYSVNVNFVDGCNINDNIHITLAVPLPVTLTSFSAAVQNCQANLNWKVSNAANFSHFVIEKSKDGRSFSGISTVSYSKNVADYSYTDKSIGEGTFYYRLKLADIDGKYEYSSIESIYAACREKQIKVYPTLTKGEVYIDLPSGYEQAQIEVYNALGQLLQLPNNDKVSQSGTHSVQLHGTAQGQYLLKIINGSEVNTYRIAYQP
jgi:hypothetical protein